MTMAKKLPLLAPSIHTFEVNGTYTDCEARRTVFMAIQKMVSAGKYYRIPYHGSSKKGYSYKRKDGGLTITLADYPDFKKRYITLSGVNLARIAGDPSRLSLTDLSPEGLAMQEQAFLDELEQLGLLEIEDIRIQFSYIIRHCSAYYIIFCPITLIIDHNHPQKITIAFCKINNFSSRKIFVCRNICIGHCSHYDIKFTYKLTLQ